MPKLLIIADDFTGSLDTGVQFSKHGIDTLVEIMRDGKARLDADCEVLVVDTDSRHLSPRRAYARVAGLVGSAAAAGFTHIFKKTDSTLRGNVGSELAALLEHSRETELIFMPAFPKSGRFTIRGKQFLGDTPITQTEIAADRFNPVRHDAVADIIHEQTALPVRCVHDRYEELLEPPGEQKSILVADGRSDEDLFRFGGALEASQKLRCLAGCAGFAALLPDLIGFRHKQPRIQTGQGNRLLVSGSINPLAQAQAAYAIAHCGYKDQALTIGQKLAIGAEAPHWRALAAALRSHGKAALWSKGTWEALEAADAEAAKRGIPLKEVPVRIADNIGGMVKALILSRCVQSLLVFGGDTLLGVSRQLGCCAIRPVTEVLPGVVLARFAEDAFARMDIITKAGGFGEEDVVARIDAFLDSHID